MKPFPVGCAVICLAITGLWTLPAQALDAGAVRAFLDGYLPQAMASRHIPGLEITVVEGDTPLVTKGYGVADLASRRPVDPDKTLFDVQSVSKLVVSTAVMIAAQRGEVKLDVDVNRYLHGFKLPDTWSSPITLASLMTHTSGLEDRGIGITARTPVEVQPLGEYLGDNLTRRVAPPFTHLLYSDQGMSLAAYTVQSASGMPYDQFARRYIFEPLGMDHTWYRQVPSGFKADRSFAYSFEDGRLVPVRHYYYNIWPTSSLWTTASDMSRFIAMQLSGGQFHGTRILDQASIRQLHTRHFSYDPRMPGVCFDFFEHFENGRRLLIHSGGGSGFASELMLMPAEHVGYFVTYNGYDGSLIAALRTAFLQRFYPAPKAAPAVATERLSASQLAPFEGWYWATRYDRTTIEKLTSLTDGYLEVKASAGGLIIGGQRFLAVDSELFVHRAGHVARYVTFRKDKTGRVAWLLSADGEAPYARVPWFLSQPVQLAIPALCALAFALAVLFIPLAVWRRRLAWRWPTVYLLVVAAGNLTGLVLLAVNLTASSLPSKAVSFELGLPAGLRLLVACMDLLAVFNLASPLVAVFAWRDRPRSTARGIAAIAFSGFALLNVWFLDYWHVIGAAYSHLIR